MIFRPLLRPVLETFSYCQCLSDRVSHDVMGFKKRKYWCWVCASSWLLSANCLRASVILPNEEGSKMNNESLKNNIATLKKLRDAYHSQLDASDREELDDVLKQLMRLAQLERDNIPLGELSVRVLLIIELIIRLVTNLTDLMK